MLPDICGALESDNGFASGERYKAWYDAWLGPKYAEVGMHYSFTADDLWYLRCALAHQEEW